MGFQFDQPTTQYAIYLPDRGYYNGFSAGVYESGDYSAIEDFDAATKALDSCRKAYERMGAPEIGETAIIVTRTVTLSATLWMPMTKGKSE